MMQNKRMLLSVIIPVYNVREYVLQAINSVIQQTIKPYEIIIVDDGSTDDSGELVETHYGHLPYVKIIHTKNQGLGEARNVGTRVATGDYIYYFDSDDLLEEHLIADFEKALNDNKDLDVYVFSAESFIDDIQESKAETKKLPQYLRGEDKVYSTGILAYSSLSKRGAFFPNAWIYIFKRDIQVNKNLFFKPIIHEDEEFTPRLFFEAGKIVVTKNVYFRRRMRLGSIMHTKRTERNVIGYIESIHALEGLLSKGSYTASKFLRARIVSHLINIHLIKTKNSLILSDAVNKQFDYFCKKYNGVFLRVAKFNIFTYMVLRFFLRRLGYKKLL